ncbi:MAG: hypothetical protein JWO86_8788 [Myxococcaceae bacterium]|jgi:hypothetical protein|nr:hypothetical protein [Myxococcaceae bacterium]MEA2753155.1 hypothetical protein [Myxococcales bacterium]
MTTISRGISLVSALSLVAVIPLVSGCGLFKKKGDEGDAAAEAAVAEVAEAAPPPAATPAAANENDVSRFPDEKKIENVTATLQRPTNVREIPGIGKVVAALTKGGNVTEIASRSTFFLVTFTNPADNKTLMGWISQDSFTAPVAITAKPLACTLPETALISDSPFCGKVCVNDVDCPSGQACKGHANKFDNAKLGAAVGVCTIFTPPAAATAPQAANLGRVPQAVALTPPPAPAAGVNAVPPRAGLCPVGFALITKDNQCHRAGCSINTCGAGQFCVPCAGANVCTANKDFCK